MVFEARLAMPVITDYGVNAGYGQVTNAHLGASVTALRELALIASTGAATLSAASQKVRLGLIDHGACLNQLLFGFAMHLGTGHAEAARQQPRMPPPPPTHTIRNPAGTAENPLVYAVVANHPVAVQLEHTITFLARLVARRVITPNSLSGGTVTKVDDWGSRLDARADSEVRDLLRAKGWRAAAEELSTRAAASGKPLVVEYSPTLLSAEQIAWQVPILRRIYNESPRVRDAIDILATLMSQGMTTVGGRNAETAGFVRDLLDLGLNRTYLAHLMRDAFVCGNGYLSYGSAPDEDTRLLMPESVSIRDDGTYVERTARGDLTHRMVIHIKGASQPDSRYGLTILEPLTALQVQKEMAQGWVAVAEAWDSDDVPREHREYAKNMLPLAERTFEAVDKQTRQILGPVLDGNTLNVSVPSALYFTGSEVMEPAAQAVSITISENS